MSEKPYKGYISINKLIDNKTSPYNIQQTDSFTASIDTIRESISVGLKVLKQNPNSNIVIELTNAKITTAFTMVDVALSCETEGTFQAVFTGIGAAGTSFLLGAEIGALAGGTAIPIVGVIPGAIIGGLTTAIFNVFISKAWDAAYDDIVNIKDLLYWDYKADGKLDITSEFLHIDDLLDVAKSAIKNGVEIGSIITNKAKYLIQNIKKDGILDLGLNLLPLFSEPTATLVGGLIPKIVSTQSGGFTFGFYQAENTTNKRYDPLLLDLDGDGVISTTTAQNGVYLDFDNNGFAESMAWASGKDGVLTIDRNNNGKVDNVSELFGSLTETGFSALSKLDTNSDGIINVKDAEFNNLKVVLADGSLKTLTEAGIKDLNTSYQSTFNTDTNGNIAVRTGIYTKTDDTTGILADYLLERNVTDSVSTNNIEISEEITALPDAKGYGNVMFLREAMQIDESGRLKALVTQFTKETSLSERDNLLDEILIAWCNADNSTTQSRGAFDSKKLAVLEAFMGEYYKNNENSIVDDNSDANTFLDNSYKTLKNEVYAQLMSQSILKTLYETSYVYESSINSIIFSLDAAKSKILSDIAQNPTTGKQELFEFARSLKTLKLTDNEVYTDFYTSLSVNNEYKTILDSSANMVILPKYDDYGENTSEGTILADTAFGDENNNRISTRQGNDINTICIHSYKKTA